MGIPGVLFAPPFPTPPAALAAFTMRTAPTATPSLCKISTPLTTLWHTTPTRPLREQKPMPNSLFGTFPWEARLITTLPRIPTAGAVSFPRWIRASTVMVTWQESTASNRPLLPTTDAVGTPFSRTREQRRTAVNKTSPLPPHRRPAALLALPVWWQVACGFRCVPEGAAEVGKTL